MFEAMLVSAHKPLLSPVNLSLEPYAAGEHRVYVSGLVGQVEAVLSVPDGEASGFAVVCHPHPLMGGTMDNKVVTTLARACRDAGLVAIRFNFRGVAASAGSFDQGEGEQGDVMAVANWAQAQFKLPLRVLAGFSFGAYVAAQVSAALSQRATADVTVQPALWLVAPPVTRFTLSPQALPAATRVIYGDADEVVDPAAIADWLTAVPDSVQIMVVPGAGHFFHGQLGVLKAWAQAACGEAVNER